MVLALYLLTGAVAYALTGAVAYALTGAVAYAAMSHLWYWRGLRPARCCPSSPWPSRWPTSTSAAGDTHADPFEVPVEGSHSGTVTTTRAPLFVPADRADAYRLPDLDRERGVVTYLGLPIQSGAEVLGVLVIGAERPRTWNGQEIDVLSSFADQAAVALTNAHLYEAEAAVRAEAEDALAQVRTLRGLLPICAWCKRVRNDQNYWEQIESYVSTHSSATFTHGICPNCRAKMLPS